MSEDCRPPESAELVAVVSLGGGNSHRSYFLSVNKEALGKVRSGWTLWETGRSDFSEQPLGCRVAFACPYDGSPSTFVAERLLTKTWEEERMWGLLPDYAAVETPGLLSAQDIQRIFAQVF
jgi:hypothetical protein